MKKKDLTLEILLNTKEKMILIWNLLKNLKWVYLVIVHNSSKNEIIFYVNGKECLIKKGE